MNATLPQSILDLGSLWLQVINATPIESLDAIREDFRNNMLPLRDAWRRQLADVEKHKDKQLDRVAAMESRLDAVHWEDATVEETEAITESHSEIHIGVRELQSLVAELRGAVLVFDELIKAAESVIARRVAEASPTSDEASP